MPSKAQFDPQTLSALQQGRTLRLMAGDRPHRYIGIWMVVVEQRLFVRSWSINARSWYRTFLTEPRGFIQIAKQTIPVRAARVRSERLLGAVDRAYLQKYNTPGALKYARDLGSAKSRGTTTELMPAPGARGGGRPPAD